MPDKEFSFFVGEDVGINVDVEDDFKFSYGFNNPSDESSIKPAGIELLEEIAVPENVRSLDIDIRPYKSDYDIIFCYGEVTLTASDWLYIVRNGSSASGGAYTQGAFTTRSGVMFLYFPMFGYTTRRISINFNQSTSSTSNADTNNYFLYTYKDTTKIKAGSKFRLYGMKLANLNELQS